jgi:hypothetical protein
MPLAPSPASGSASNGSGRRPSGRPSSAGKRSGRSAGASRLRPPDAAALAAMAAAEAAMGLASSGAAEPEVDAPPVAPGEGPEGGYEVPVLMGSEDGGGQQQGGDGSGDEGPDLVSMVDRIGSMLAHLAPDQPMLGSQHDMPPPPPRGRGEPLPALHKGWQAAWGGASRRHGSGGQREVAPACCGWAAAGSWAGIHTLGTVTFLNCVSFLKRHCAAAMHCQLGQQ